MKHSFPMLFLSELVNADALRRLQAETAAELDALLDHGSRDEF